MKMPQIEVENGVVTNYDKLNDWAMDNSPTYRAINEKDLSDAIMIFTLLRLTEELQDTINMLQTGYPRTDRERAEAMKKFLLENQQESRKQLLNPALDTKV